MNNNFERKIITRTLYTSILLIVVIVIVVLIPNKYIPYQNDWISFYGSFVGAIISGIVAGLLTYEGVKKTIVYSEETRKDDFIKSIMPYLNMEVVGASSDLSKAVFTVDNKIATDDYRTQHIMLVKFRNIGMKAAINIRMQLQLISNSIVVDEESEEIPIIIYISTGDLDVNKYIIEVDFYDLAGNYYTQKYDLTFVGKFNIKHMKPYSNMPKIQ